MYRSHLFVLTSRYEWFCRVIIEAMVCNTPVISSNCNAWPSELIDDTLYSKTNIDTYKLSKYWILVKKDNIESYVKSIELLLNKSDLREKYTEAWKNRSKDFDVDNIIWEWDKIL